MEKQVEMVFWDVQHGHATYIKSPNNRHIVVDLGTGDYSGKNLEFSPLNHLKNHYGVKQLDYVIITHPHLDHIDDILNFDSLSPKVLCRPSQLTNAEVLKDVRKQDEDKFKKYCELNDRYTGNITGTTDDPTIPANYGDMKISIFHSNTCSHDNFNNHSIVAVFEFASIKVVIPGDNQKESYDELLKSQNFQSAIKNSDLLLAPHHGRDSGVNKEFIDLVNPRLTVVSDGRFCDTSANATYSQKSRGWKVHKNGSSIERKCLTTNSDGEIYVQFGYDSDQTRFLSVNIK